MALFDSSGNVNLGSSGLGGAMGSFGNAAQDLMSVGAYKDMAEGDVKVANDYAKVAAMYGQEMNITKGSGDIQLGQEQRQIQKVEGQQESSAGGANVTAGGSAGDILRDTMRQGALAKMTIEGKTAIDLQAEKIAQQGALTQEDSALNAAKVAMDQASSAGIAGIFSMATGILGLL